MVCIYYKVVELVLKFKFFEIKFNVFFIILWNYDFCLEYEYRFKIEVKDRVLKDYRKEKIN